MNKHLREMTAHPIWRLSLVSCLCRKKARQVLRAHQGPISGEVPGKTKREPVVSGKTCQVLLSREWLIITSDSITSTAIVQQQTELSSDSATKIRNFGNLPFSSSIGSNHYPIQVQEQRYDSVFLQLWAPPCLTDASKIISTCPTAELLNQAQKLIKAGQSADKIISPHFDVRAILVKDAHP